MCINSRESVDDYPRLSVSRVKIRLDGLKSMVIGTLAMGIRSRWMLAGAICGGQFGEGSVFEIGRRANSVCWGGETKGRTVRARGQRGLQLPFITLLGPIDITDWYSAPMPPSKDPTDRHEGD